MSMINYWMVYVISFVLKKMQKNITFLPFDLFILNYCSYQYLLMENIVEMFHVVFGNSLYILFDI